MSPTLPTTLFESEKDLIFVSLLLPFSSLSHDEKPPSSRWFSTTKISENDFTEFLGNYNFDEGATFSGIKGGTSNSNYLVKIKNDKYILTIFEERTNQDNLSYRCLRFRSSCNLP